MNLLPLFISVYSASASTINAVLMRYHELSEGIEVVDAEGHVIGTSTIAAKKVSEPVKETNVFSGTVHRYVSGRHI